MTGSQADALIAERRAAGLDARDEVWEGVYRVAPYASSAHSDVESQLHRVLWPYVEAAGLTLAGPLNVGTEGKDNYRIPDLTVRDPGPGAAFFETLRVAVEVLSPHDDTFAKFDFYAAHSVDEILVADPDARTVQCWRLTAEGSYVPIGSSLVLQATCADLAAAITWPA